MAGELKNWREATVPVVLTIPQVASILSALDAAIKDSRSIDNVTAFTDAKAAVLMQVRTVV